MADEALTPAEAFARVGWTAPTDSTATATATDAATEPRDPRLPDAATMDALRSYYDAIVQRRIELADAALATSATSSTVVALSTSSTSPYRFVLSAS